MKKRTWILAILTALALAVGVARAAELSNWSGQSCGDSSGTWHFVNNQTGGAEAGTLVAEFEGGTCEVTASTVNKSMQHFYCTGYSGQLLSATTGALPGKLVLSDFTCDTKCDPKTQVCR